VRPLVNKQSCMSELAPSVPAYEQAHRGLEWERRNLKQETQELANYCELISVFSLFFGRAVHQEHGNAENESGSGPASAGSRFWVGVRF
jgi:hypothetical protein